MATLTLTDKEIRGFPEPYRKFLLDLFLPMPPVPMEGAQPEVQPVPARATPNLGPSDATPQQAKDMLNAFHHQTRTLIEHAVSASKDGFNVPDLAAKMGLAPGKLGGSWSGVTKVSRRILGGGAMLVDWTHLHDGSWHGRMSPMTRASFRQVLGIN